MNTRRTVFIALAASALTALAAQAQNQPVVTRSTLRPPQPNRAEGVPFTSYGAVLVVMIAPLLVNFISSKRGHQD